MTRVVEKSGVEVAGGAWVGVGVGVGPNKTRVCTSHNIPPKPKSRNAATKRLMVMISALRFRDG
jgi:hypothetical protein